MSYPPKPIGEFNELDCLRALVAGLIGVNSVGELTFLPNGAIPTTFQTVTRHSILLDSGGTAAQIIPTGAKGYGFTVITGTASDGTASGLPVGFSQSDPNTLAAGFTVTASGGTTFVYFNT